MVYKSSRILPHFLCFVLFLCSCEREEGLPQLHPETNEHVLGGATSINDRSVNAFGFPSPTLERMEELDFAVGNSFFNQNWVTAPASTTARDGLGPLFNSRSCSACHFKDGRGKPPEYGGDVNHGLLLRLSVPGMDSHNGPIPDPIYGDQLQDQAIYNTTTEASFSISYDEIEGQFTDGTLYTLRKPTYQITKEQYGPASSALMISPRVAPQMIGMGLLEAIPEFDLLAHVDEFDEDKDGISGRPNYVYDIESNSNVLGRFGWKANQPTLKQQVAAAFSGDMGLTTSLFPKENCPNNNCDSIPNGGSPEVDDASLGRVVLYSSSLGVPIRRDYKEIDVLKGKMLFRKAGCNKCHVENYITGSHPSISGLSNQSIKPYTDLLLHDMGDQLADGRPDYRATGNEWRTPPLWGIGLFSVVNGHTFYLHDGRARNLEEAILWHGGEGESSKNNFLDMSQEERNQLIKFLNSL